MSQSIREYENALVELNARFNHIPAGARGVPLMTTILANASAEKGGALSLQDASKVCAILVERLVKAGLVRP